MRRAEFCAVNAQPYAEFCARHVGILLEAFHSAPTLLVGEPIMCHRAGDAETSAVASQPFELIGVLQHLLDIGAITGDDIVATRESAEPRGHLVDELVEALGGPHAGGIVPSLTDLESAREFFGGLELTHAQKHTAFARLREAAALCGRDSTVDPGRSIGGPAATISVVTPSFNQAPFLPQCLDSVRAQTVAPLEHFVLDPGSTDGSREIAAEYSHVTLIAESDSGQSDAVNKGFQAATGDVIAWLNSDDAYPHASVFEHVLARFNEEDGPDIVYGRGSFVDVDGTQLRLAHTNTDPATLHRRLQHEIGMLQPAIFMRRSVVDRVGRLRADSHYAMDYEFWIRCVDHGMKFVFLDEPLALARYYPENKTFGQRGESYAELCDAAHTHFGYVHPFWLRRFAEFNVEGHDGVLASASRSGLSRPEDVERELARLLCVYNGSYDHRDLVDRLRDLPGYGDTARLLDQVGDDRFAPCGRYRSIRRAFPVTTVERSDRAGGRSSGGGGRASSHVRTSFFAIRPQRVRPTRASWSATVRA